MTVGSRIRELRKEKGETLEETADELGISYNTLSAYERGERLPPVDKLLLIARYFGVSADYLLGLIDDSEALATADLDDLLVDELDRDIFRALSNLSPRDKMQALRFIIFLDRASGEDVRDIEW